MILLLTQMAKRRKRMKKMIRSWLKSFEIMHILNAKRHVKINKKLQRKLKDPTKYALKQYENYYKRKPNLTNPTRFSEFMLWQKLFFYKEEATTLTDKVESKKLINEMIGTEITFPKTYAVFDNAEDIIFENLPQKCVIKCNHISGSVFLVEKLSKNKYLIKNLKYDSNKSIKFRTLQKVLNEMLKINHYYYNLEWNYKNIVPKILVEEYLDTKNLRDYKFYMNYDKLIAFHIASNRATDERNDFFDANLQPLDIWADVPPSDKVPSLPDNILQMIEIAKKIAKDYPVLRVDLYNINGKIYFSEATFYHLGGLLRFKSPKNFDELMGENMSIKAKDKK